jgi:uncharacterized protein (UPF0335 family)
MQTIGHNSVDQQLKTLIERIERLEGEKHDLAEDIKSVYQEAKRAGFDPKIIRELIKERKADPAKLAEQQETLESYRNALGAFIDTPLGKAAVDAAA